MSAIGDNIVGLKDHVLNDLPFFTAGYENLTALTRAVVVYSPDLNEREYYDVRFSDMLGNYFWIEKISEVNFTGLNMAKEALCKGRGYEAIQRYSLYAFADNLKEIEFFECLVGSISDYGCNVTILSGNYDTIGVLTKYLTDAEISRHVISNIGNHVAVRVDFQMKSIILPSKHNIENCYCDVCKDC